MSVKNVSRSSGRSVCAAAAYQAAAYIHDRRTGLTHDYRRKQGVVSVDVVLPNRAPEWASNSTQLWNAAERAEKRRDACVAREYEIALPDELSNAERGRLALDFARDMAEKEKCAVQVSIHLPGRGGDRRNHHAHLLRTTRKIEPDGFGEKLETEKAGRKRKDDLQNIRERWAHFVNEALMKAGLRERVDHRSLEAQGINRPAGIHNGPVVTSILRRGGHSYIEQRRVIEILAAASQEGRQKRQAEDIKQQIIMVATDIKQALLERDQINVAASMKPTFDELRARSRINKPLESLGNDSVHVKNVEANIERPR